ncbi:hypothetical protein D3C73_668090 [compost metagenome]
MLVPARTNVPAPSLVIGAAPIPTTLPSKVRVVPPFATSTAAPAIPLIVKPRSVVAVFPVYRNIPPVWMTRLEEADEDAPIPLATPPSANASTSRVPPLMVVTPT